MCDSPSPTAVRPRWHALYLRLLVAAAAGVLLAVSSAGPVLRTALGCALAAGAAGAALGWVRSNAAALDQSEWCACAGTTVTTRIIASRPRRRRRRRRRTGATLPV